MLQFFVISLMDAKNLMQNILNNKQTKMRQKENKEVCRKFLL